MRLRVRRYRRKSPITRASVAITFFAENRRRFDLTNAAESVMDLLVDAEILADDSWAVVPDLALHFGAVDPNNHARKWRSREAVDNSPQPITMRIKRRFSQNLN
jgi:hypothetical protein